MKRNLYFVTLTIIIMLISCNEDSYNAEVETELIQYFHQFESEAALRNVSVDMDIVNVSGYIENINDRGVLGQCKSYSDGSQSVIIDDNYWEDASDSEKEYIIFHELGHCVLGREHNDEENENGICLSIMQSGANRCRGIYNEDNREALLDELFNN